MLYGHNGAGKTNLLEAIAYLALGRSPRAVRDAELVRHGQSAFQVAATFTGAQLAQAGIHPTELAAEYTIGRRRLLRRDGRPVTASQLYGRLLTVSFTPDDLWLLKGSPAARRVLLDRLLVQAEPLYADAYRRYAQALLQRNASLRAIRAGRGDRALLAIWDPQLIRYGGQLQRRRAAAVEALSGPAGMAYRSLAPATEALVLRYLPSAGTDGEGDAWDDRLEQALRRHRERDLAAGSTTSGPHRDDLELEVGGRSARHFASQGQQRSAVLALKFAERSHLASVHGRLPVLLVDDVLSELDPLRQRALQELLVAQGQVLLTTADHRQVAALAGAVRFQVRAGEVRREA